MCAGCSEISSPGTTASTITRVLTPYEVHYGLAAAKIERRADVLSRAYAEHPEPFVRGRPRPPALPQEVWINKPILGTAALIAPPEACRAKTDLATASRTNDLEVGRGTAIPEPEEIPLAVAL